MKLPTIYNCLSKVKLFN